METTSTIENSSVAPYRPNFLHQILAGTALAVGGILTIMWIAFLIYGAVRVFEAAV